MSFQSLYNYYWNTDTIRPIIVIDYKVVARDIEFHLKSHLNEVQPNWSEKTLHNIIKALWAFKLNRGTDCLDLHLPGKLGFTGIVVDDIKGKVPHVRDEDKRVNENNGIEFNTNFENYWRDIVAYRLELPTYKGGRPPKDELLLKIIEIGINYIENENTNFHYIAERYFEADDIAGQICRYRRENNIAAERAIYLSTLDGDWQVLVDDDYMITWCNTKSFNDRIRGNVEVLDYYHRREGVILTHPNEVSQLKVIRGDLGDNLMAGSPLRLFDLLAEDVEFQLSPETKGRIKNAMQSRTKSNCYDHYDLSTKFLLQHSVPLPEVLNPSERSYEYWRDNIQYRKTIYQFSELYEENEHLFQQKDLVKV